MVQDLVAIKHLSTELANVEERRNNKLWGELLDVFTSQCISQLIDRLEDPQYLSYEGDDGYGELLKIYIEELRYST